MNNKQIPEAYFQASPAQRLALLQGLMDTDGTCGTNGHIEFALNNERLARQTQRLILSLGHKVRMTSRLVTHGKGVGSTNYRMTWTAPDPVFRLPRRLGRQKIATAGWSRRRFILSVEPVPSIPVRCLRVSGPSHLFLVGEECVATHNSMKTAEAGFSKVRDRLGAHGIEKLHKTTKASSLFTASLPPNPARDA